VVARAYDNSVVDEEMVKHGGEIIPKTNCKETPKHRIFWFEDVDNKIKVEQTWVPRNGRIDIIGKTGFYPHGKVEIWLMSDGTGNSKDPYKTKIKLKEVVAARAEVKTDENGCWSAEITIPRSFGGPHAIYAYEYKLKTDPGKPRPIPSYVKSGWA